MKPGPKRRKAKWDDHLADDLDLCYPPPPALGPEDAPSRHVEPCVAVKLLLRWIESREHGRDAAAQLAIADLEALALRSGKPRWEFTPWQPPGRGDHSGQP